MYKARTSNAIDKVRAERESGSENKGVRISLNDDVTPQYSIIKCSSLLCCVRKSCDADVFSAMNESGLVYDGGAVVDQVSVILLEHHVLCSLWCDGAVQNRSGLLNLFCSAMFCNVMLCHVMLCMLCYASYVILCYVMLCYVM